jgi:uncharacterized membrane protein YbhN (UPF0104 family)
VSKRVAITVLRVVVSLSILVYIVTRISTDDLLARARDAAYLRLAAVALLFVLMALLVALRWRLLAGWLGLALPARLAVRAVFLGLFGGQLLPSSIGSDVLRGWVVGRQTGRIRLVAASLVADRLTAFCGASLLLALAYALVARGPSRLPAIVVSAAAFATAALLLAFLAASTGRLQGLEMRPVATDVAIQLVSLTGVPAYLSRPFIHATRSRKERQIAERRYAELEQVANEPSLAAALGRLRELGIRWYIVPGTAGPGWDPGRGHAAFVAGEIAVYRVDGGRADEQ